MRMAARRLLPMLFILFLNLVIDALLVCGAHFGIDILLTGSLWSRDTAIVLTNEKYDWRVSPH